MYFRQLLHEDRACVSYLIGCPSQGVCVAVDPQGDPAEYIARAADNGMVLSGVLETHLHADHLSSARELAERAGVPHYLGWRAVVDYPFEPLREGQVVEVGNRRIRVIETPGHTPEHVSLLVDDWFVLTGDTLFVGDVGRVDLALEPLESEAVRARALELHGSLGKLLELPDWTEVYPGHYAGSVCGRGMDGKAVSTIGRERRHNRALSLAPDAFVEYLTSAVPPLPADFHAIKRRNLGRAA